MSAADSIDVVKADLASAEHGRAVVALTAAYALDPMGNAGPLPPPVLDRLLDGLRSHPGTVIFLAYVGGRPAGIATCFRGFSTFTARPVLNLHDLAVLPEHRGRGLGPRLLAAVEAEARALGCSTLTLEVQENNTRARRVYERAGFGQAVHDPAAGGALFYRKKL